MVDSMTGFATFSFSTQKGEGTLELRSLNHRYIDIVFRGKSISQDLEDEARKLVKKFCRRGYIAISLNILSSDNRSDDIKLLLNEKLLLEYLNAIEKIDSFLKFEPKRFSPIDILRLPSVFTHSKEDVADDDQFSSIFLESLEKGLVQLKSDREREGLMIVETINERIDLIEKVTDSIIEDSSFSIEAEVEKIRKRIKTLLPDISLDDERLLQEIAIIADKSDISEEIERLKIHIGYLRDLFKEDEVGKKLEFYMQELNREINTVASKSKSKSMAGYIVSIKSEIEKIREQGQNLE